MKVLKKLKEALNKIDLTDYDWWKAPLCEKKVMREHVYNIIHNVILSEDIQLNDPLYEDLWQWVHAYALQVEDFALVEIIENIAFILTIPVGEAAKQDGYNDL